MEENALRAVVDVSRSDANVIDETERCFVETDVMNDVGYDKAIGARFVVETFKRADFNGRRFNSRVKTVWVRINGIKMNHISMHHLTVCRSPSVAVQLVINGG